MGHCGMAHDLVVGDGEARWHGVAAAAARSGAATAALDERKALISVRAGARQAREGSALGLGPGSGSGEG